MRITVLVVAIGILVVNQFGKLAHAEDRAAMHPNDDDRLATRSVIQVLETNHTTRRRFDETLYKRTIDNLLDRLDGRRLFLAKADVEPFYERGKLCVEAIRAGDPSLAFELIDLWQKRMSERFSVLVAVIDQPYQVDEHLRLNGQPRKFAATKEELEERWRQQIQIDLTLLKRFGILGKSSKEQLLASYRIGLSDLKETFDPRTVFLSSIARAYDPHTDYLDERDLCYFNDRLARRSLAGIGVALEWLDGFLSISSVVGGGPASRTSLSPGDRILAVSDEASSTVFFPESWSDYSGQKYLVGKPGSTVRLLVLRFGADIDVRDIPIAREKS